jgi:hypothetical protein
MENTLLLSLGIFLIVEGLLPALFPNRWRAYLLKLLEQPIESIRTIGTVTVLSGFLILYMCL